MQQPVQQSLTRRSLLAGSAGLAGAAALTRSRAFAQQKAQLGAPASVVTNPPRDWTPGRPSIYPDPDVIVVDPSFLPLRRAQGAIYRVWTGALWAEGPTWSNQGQYLVFSDVSGNTLYRYIWDDGRVTASAGHPITPMATLSIFRAGSCLVRTSRAVSCAGSTTGR